MSEYLVSARKYRPLEFEDVVGQEHITKTLRNAIEKSHVGHAYLFCGPRGVGKTTCARIFANSVNNNNDSDYNIFELDGASNNSVDDIRNLIDQVKIPPQIGKYKIYIIDEVHMLSKAAFNAFLKTLEEPPKHSIFILATTEKEKIIPTILSRCQIFDFNRITKHQITQYLLKITKKENIKAHENTLQLIAEKADGALRDALSIFDRIYTLCNDSWDHAEVAKILLSLDAKFAIELVENIIKKQISNCLLTINSVIENGFESKEIIRCLITHFRNLIAAKDDKTIELIYEKTDIKTKLIDQTNTISNQQILLALNCLHECDKNYAKSINQRFLVELCIMQLCSISDIDIKKKLPIPKYDKQLAQNTDNDDKRHENPKLKPHHQIPSNKIESDLDLNNQSQKDKTIKNTTIETASNPNDQSKKEKTIKNTTIETASNPNDQSQKEETIKNTAIGSELISITEELNSIDEKIASNTQEEKEDWTQIELLRTWKHFAEKLKKNKKINLYNIFERHLPKKQDNQLILALVSLSEKSEIEGIKVDLLEFLKKELQNDFLEMIIHLSKDNNKNMLHTKEEKYKHILEKNDKLTILQKELKLNII